LKTLVIRADASTSIGTGHIIRCLVLADAFKLRNWKTIFISRKLPGNLLSLIKKKHFLIELQTPDNYKFNEINHDNYIENLGVSWSEDANETIEAIKKLANIPDLLVVDHYSLDILWENKLRSFVGKIFVIDDLAKNNHEADFILNQDYLPNYKKHYKNLNFEKSKLLLGTKYALIHPDFCKARQKVNRDRNIKKILVFYGGTDISNETGKALCAINNLNQTDIKIDVVIGSANPHGLKLINIFASNSNIKFFKPQNNLANLMLNADIFFGAGGSTTIETLCMGLPSLLTTTAKNQVPFIHFLDDKGIVTYLGTKEDVKQADIEISFQKLLKSTQILEHQSKQGMKLVDGKGVRRLMVELVN
jgi:UDP-2,4-diacetamido-2,4,6-trideoxy-beta-L-altropyranose hydrolase